MRLSTLIQADAIPPLRQKGVLPRSREGCRALISKLPPDAVRIIQHARRGGRPDIVSVSKHDDIWLSRHEQTSPRKTTRKDEVVSGAKPLLINLQKAGWLRSATAMPGDTMLYWRPTDDAIKVFDRAGL